MLSQSKKKGRNGKRKEGEDEFKKPGRHQQLLQLQLAHLTQGVSPSPSPVSCPARLQRTFYHSLWSYCLVTLIEGL